MTTSPRTLVIFGAGASYRCVFSGISVTPITAQIPDQIRRYSSRCSAVVDHLERELIEKNVRREIFDFENCLRSLWETFKNDPVLSPQFEEFRIALLNLIRESQNEAINQEDDNFYTAFFNRFLLSKSRLNDGRKLTAINMNYDSIAEHALNSRRPMRAFQDYIESENRPISLFQPHGSVNWIEADNSRSFSLGAERKASSTRGNTLWMHNILNNSAKPALALPMSGDYGGKTVWPVLHEDSLRQQLSEIDEVIIVGWRATDDHILKMIGAASPSFTRIIVADIGMDSCQEILDRFALGVGISVQSGQGSPEGFAGLFSQQSGKQSLIDKIFSAAS